MGAFSKPNSQIKAGKLWNKYLTKEEKCKIIDNVIPSWDTKSDKAELCSKRYQKLPDRLQEDLIGYVKFVTDTPNRDNLWTRVDFMK